jgi:hypothetical protein
MIIISLMHNMMRRRKKKKKMMMMMDLNMKKQRSLLPKNGLFLQHRLSCNRMKH